MLRSLCAALGAVSLAGTMMIGAIVIWAQVQESCDRNAQRRRQVPLHDCRLHETIYAEASAYLEYRCTLCHRPRILGGVRCTASNRRTRRSV